MSKEEPRYPVRLTVSEKDIKAISFAARLASLGIWLYIIGAIIGLIPICLIVIFFIWAISH